MFDPAAADLLSPLFWRALGHLTHEVWEQGELELERLAYQQDLAVFQAAVIADKKVDEIAKSVDRSLDAVRNRLQPWYRKQRAVAVQELANTMDAKWVEAWGDPADPAVKAKIEEARQALLPMKVKPSATQPQKSQRKTAKRWQPKRAR